MKIYYWKFFPLKTTQYCARKLLSECGCGLGCAYDTYVYGYISVYRCVGVCGCVYVGVYYVHVSKGKTLYFRIGSVRVSVFVFRQRQWAFKRKRGRHRESNSLRYRSHTGQPRDVTSCLSLTQRYRHHTHPYATSYTFWKFLPLYACLPNRQATQTIVVFPLFHSNHHYAILSIAVLIAVSQSVIHK